MAKSVFERPTITRLTPGIPSKHGVGSVLAPMPMIEGVKVDDLMNKYGSPLYVFSERDNQEWHGRHQKGLFSLRYPKVQMAWSYKTNYLDAVLQNIS